MNEPRDCQGIWIPLTDAWDSAYQCSLCYRIIDDLQHSHIGGAPKHLSKTQCEQLQDVWLDQG